MIIFIYLYHRITVGKKVFQLIQKSLILDQGSVNVIQFGDAYSSCLSHIWIFILEAFSQWLAKILCDFVDSDTTHRSYCQCTYQGIRILAVLRNKSEQARDSSLVTITAIYFRPKNFFFLFLFFFLFFFNVIERVWYGTFVIGEVASSFCVSERKRSNWSPSPFSYISLLVYL